MKIMKRIIMSCLILLAALATMLLFAACDDDSDTGDHQHSYASEVVAPTCTANGYTKHTCACGDSYTDTETPAAHTMTLVERKAPTCTAQGQTEYSVCSACGHIEGEQAAIPMIDHLYKTTYEYPTAGKAGSKTRVCQNCNHTQVTAINALSVTLPNASEVLAKLIGTVEATIKLSEGSELVFVSEPIEYTTENGTKSSVFFEIAEAAVNSNGEVFQGHIKLKVGMAAAALTGAVPAQNVAVNKQNAKYLEMYIYVNGEDVSIEMNGEEVFAGNVSEELYGALAQAFGWSNPEDAFESAYVLQALKSIMPVIEKTAAAVVQGIPTVNPEYIDDLADLFEAIGDDILTATVAPNGNTVYTVNPAALKKLLDGAQDKTIIQYISDVCGKDTADALISFLEDIDSKTVKEIVDRAIDFAEISDVELNDIYTAIDLYVYFATNTAFDIEQQLVSRYDSTVAEIIAELNGIGEDKKAEFIKSLDDSLTKAATTLKTTTIDQILSSIFMGTEEGFVQSWNQMLDMLDASVTFEITVDSKGNIVAINAKYGDNSLKYESNDESATLNVVLSNKTEINATVNDNGISFVIKVDGNNVASGNLTVSQESGTTTITAALRDSNDIALLSYNAVMVNGVLTHADFSIKGYLSTNVPSNNNSSVLSAGNELVTLFAMNYDKSGENTHTLKLLTGYTEYTITAEPESVGIVVRMNESTVATATLSYSEAGLTFKITDGQNTMLNFSVALNAEKTAIENASLVINDYVRDPMGNRTLEQIFHASFELTDNATGMDFVRIECQEKVFTFGYEVTQGGIKLSVADQAENIHVSLEILANGESVSLDALAKILGADFADMTITVTKATVDGEYHCTVDIDLDRLMIIGTPGTQSYVTFDGAIIFQVA